MLTPLLALKLLNSRGARMKLRDSEGTVPVSDVFSRPTVAANSGL